jgi:hypothetical protein
MKDQIVSVERAGRKRTLTGICGPQTTGCPIQRSISQAIKATGAWSLHIVLVCYHRSPCALWCSTRHRAGFSELLEGHCLFWARCTSRHIAHELSGWLSTDQEVFCPGDAMPAAWHHGQNLFTVHVIQEVLMLIFTEGLPPHHYLAFHSNVVRSQATWILLFTLKMEAARSSETLVSYRNTVWRHNAEGHDLNLHRPANFKCRNIKQLPTSHISAFISPYWPFFFFSSSSWSRS